MWTLPRGGIVPSGVESARGFSHQRPALRAQTRQHILRLPVSRLDKLASDGYRNENTRIGLQANETAFRAQAQRPRGSDGRPTRRGSAARPARRGSAARQRAADRPHAQRAADPSHGNAPRRSAVSPTPRIGPTPTATADRSHAERHRGSRARPTPPRIGRRPNASADGRRSNAGRGSAAAERHGFGPQARTLHPAAGTARFGGNGRKRW